MKGNVLFHGFLTFEEVKEILEKRGVDFLEIFRAKELLPWEQCCEVEAPEWQFTIFKYDDNAGELTNTAYFKCRRCGGIYSREGIRLCVDEKVMKDAPVEVLKNKPEVSKCGVG